jgi:hypothetical protein
MTATLYYKFVSVNKRNGTLAIYLKIADTGTGHASVLTPANTKSFENRINQTSFF